MAYQTGSATSIQNMLTTLFTFASGNGWTIDKAVTSSDGYMHRNNIYVGFDIGTDELSIYQARGYLSTSPETALGSHTNSVNAYSGTERTTVNALAGTFDAYHFFESDTYIHIAIEVGDGLFRHFGFGEIGKIGTWTGGEYSYGHYWVQGSSFTYSVSNARHNIPFDGVSTSLSPASKCFAMFGTKTSGDPLPGGGTGSPMTKWYRAFYEPTLLDGDGVTSGSLYTGGNRASPHQHFTDRSSSQLNGFKPLSPIPVVITDTTTTPKVDYLMGHIPDIRLVNIGGLTTGSEYTIGSDIWIPFPVGRRGEEQPAASPITEYTRNWGYMYKKVTA